MKSYHFDLGNSTSGPIGYCARVQATSKARALVLLQETLQVEYEVESHYPSESEEGVEYIALYVNSDVVTTKHIDDWEVVPRGS